ncbi:uncharacterized protein C9orf85 homolog isoform X1 [Hemiscyllium ocellatum]|uniref:uncharacterized protein C9orf85 homolog isoform X1 n=1 Tax=Hemiscyllium ocellatum TaxID=170820 RepID=UPI0029660A1F|nr:uncharacterized protein C9orf85 homolog isoform X1 [Hemiscyllium ocellatum]
MSSQKGNVTRKRAQKHQNVVGFKNDKYDKSEKMKQLNAMVHTGVCKHCKEVLEWKIKYNKYKPLGQARKCVKCLQKTVKDSYHIMCKPCAFKLELCAKCGKKEEIVYPLASEENQRKGSNVEINLRTRSRLNSGKTDGDDDDDDNSIADSDFDCDEGNEVKDEGNFIQSSLTPLPTPHVDAALHKNNSSKTKGTEAHGMLNISMLTLDV